MKALFIFFLVITVLSVSAQETPVIKYYDSSWKQTSKSSAIFYTIIKKEGNFYIYSSHFINSQKPYGEIVTAKDTAYINNQIGLKVNYNYKSGRISDSTLNSGSGMNVFRYSFYENGNTKFISKYLIERNEYEKLGYYENGKLLVHIFFDSIKNERTCVGFTEDEKIIPNFIYQKEAGFPDGNVGWRKFLQKNLNSSLPQLNGAPPGKYTVKLNFLVNKDGTITGITTESDPGFGTKNEAIRVLNKSPLWQPAIYLNQPIAYRARQSITFDVSN